MVPGVARRSFGVWVAKLAGLPSEVLVLADRKSEGMRERARSFIIRRAVKHIADAAGVSTDSLAALLARAKASISA
jgi:DNA mismatch repair ATPase MutS